MNTGAGQRERSKLELYGDQTTYHTRLRAKGEEGATVEHFKYRHTGTVTITQLVQKSNNEESQNPHPTFLACSLEGLMPSSFCTVSLRTCSGLGNAPSGVDQLWGQCNQGGHQPNLCRVRQRNVPKKKVTATFRRRSWSLPRCGNHRDKMLPSRGLLRSSPSLGLARKVCIFPISFSLFLSDLSTQLSCFRFPLPISTANI